MTPLSPESADRLNLVERLRELSPEALKDAVRSYTAGELDQLIYQMEGMREVPAVFRNVNIRAMITERLSALEGVTEETRNKWRTLSAHIGSTKEEIEKSAEQSFMKSILEKGGGLAVLAGIGVTILGWLGVKWARNLKEGGLLDTVKKHPILVAFLSAAGISVGTAAYKYVTQNQDAIVAHIAGEARATGRSEGEMATDLGTRARNFIANIGAGTVDTMIQGFASLFHGKVDPETGVIELPYSTLRPPIIIAYQAGFRRRSFGSAWGIEHTLNSMIREGDRAVNLTNEARTNADKAKRARVLLRREFNGTIALKEIPELETLMGDLAPTLNLTKTEALSRQNRTLNQDDMRKRLKTAETNLAEQYRNEYNDFNQQKQVLIDKLEKADREVQSGKKGSLNAKARIQGELSEIIERYNDQLVKNKVTQGKEFVDAFNAHLEAHVGTNMGPLERATRTAEQCGLTVARTKIGGLALKGVVGWSFLPLGMEAVSSLAHGEINPLTSKRAQAVALDMGEAVGGFIPGVGEVLDLKGAITGKDLNGRALGTQARATMAAMGVLGTASIGLGFVTGGLSIVGFRALRGAIAGRRAWKVARTVKGVAGKADDALDIAQTLKRGEAAADTVRTFQKPTALQQKYMRARQAVHTMQRGVQLYTYGYLGVQLTTGVANLWNAGAEVIETGKQKALEGLSSAEQFVTGA